ncbi:DUF1845 domain-containing protein [Vibrio parahaemolyticus]|nr:DUF1845 domain-containing protein [Vibrio parahaemolyticus]
MAKPGIFEFAETDREEQLGATPKIVTKDHVPEKNVIKIRMYTRDGVNLLKSKKTTERHGDKNVFIPGLDWFDRKIGDMIQAAGADDPFADQMLVDLEQQTAILLNHVRAQSSTVRGQIVDMFEQYEATLNLKVQSHCSEVDVFIRNKLSVKVLWLVKEIDRLLYYVYQAEKHDLLSSFAARDVKFDAKKALRNLLRLVDGYKHTSITRKDLALSGESKRVQKAINDNRKITLSREVLFLEERADCAPYITTRHHDQLEDDVKGALEKLYSRFFEHKNHEQFGDDELTG